MDLLLARTNGRFGTGDVLIGSAEKTNISSNPRARGPFKPDDAHARVSAHLTKCRKCTWFNKFDHKNFTTYQPNPRLGIDDWCHACGRIASDKDFGKKQSTPYKGKIGDILLGTKVISFGIKAHDPRNLEEVKRYWKEHEGKSHNWVYNASDMEEDCFSHRIGKHPTLQSILASIPVVKPDSIPETGKVRGNRWDNKSAPSANEMEALLLDNAQDLDLLRELNAFSDYRDTQVNYNLQAKWDKVKRKGVSD